MKKALFLFAMLSMAISAFADGLIDNYADSIVRGNAKTDDLTKQVVVKKQQTNEQQPSQQQKASQAPATKNRFNSLNGTLITIKGHAPYSRQPEGVNWPRFGLQLGVGYIHSYFTYEGVLEFMQSNLLPDYPNYLNSLQGSARIGAVLPIQIGNYFLIIPNVKGQLGGAFGLGNMSYYTTSFQASIIGGLDLGFKLGNRSVCLGFVYEYRWYISGSSTLGVGLLGGQLAITI